MQAGGCTHTMPPISTECSVVTADSAGRETACSSSLSLASSAIVSAAGLGWAALLDSIVAWRIRMAYAARVWAGASPLTPLEI